MASSEDNTTIFRMLSHLDNFLDGNRRASVLSSRRPVNSQLSFDESPTQSEKKLPKTEPADSGNSPNPQINASAIGRSKSYLDPNVSGKRQREADAELITSKSVIGQLETKLANMESARKRLRIEKDQEIDKIKQELQSELSKKRSLQTKLEVLLEKNSDESQELADMRELLNTSKLQQEYKIKQLREEYENTIKTLQEEKTLLEHRLVEYKEEILSLKSQVNAVATENESLTAQLDHMQRREYSSQTNLQVIEEYKARMEKAELSLKELQREMSAQDDSGKVCRAMQTQVSRIPEMEKTIKRLQEENIIYKDKSANVMMLKEQVEALEVSEERSKERIAELCKLETEHSLLKNLLKQWQQLDHSSHSSPNPNKVKERFNTLERNEAGLTEQVRMLNSEVLKLQADKVRLEASTVNLNKVQQSESAIVNSVKQQCKRLQKRLGLITKERDSYRRILSSYESESTMNLTAVGQERIVELESRLAEYGKIVEELESELQSLNSSTGSEAKVPLRDAERQLAKLKEEKELLEAKLEYFTAKGYHDPSQSKVIHLKDNPMVVAHELRAARMEKLEKENQLMKQKLQLVSEAKGEVTDLTILAQDQLENPAVTKQIEELKEQLASAELKNSRLTEMFQSKANDVRKACYEILGYRLDMPRSNYYKLSNMYAESPDDYLIFKRNESGAMDLMENEFSSSLGDMIQTYLAQHNSIPAFLSNLTMELFSRTTHVMEGGRGSRSSSAVDVASSSSDEGEERDDEGEEAEEEENEEENEDEEEEEEDDEEGEEDDDDDVQEVDSEIEID